MNIKKFLLAAICSVSFSCTSDYLEVKSDQKLLVPNTLEDFQLLLDNFGVMNKTLGLGQIASDDFYITDAGFANLHELERSAYTWNLSAGEALGGSDWPIGYEQIFYANVVLEGLKKISEKTEKSNRLRGAALFYRAYALAGLVNVFAPPYKEQNAKDKIAIPLPLSADINAKRPKPTLQEMYTRILEDLKEASTLLPAKPLFKTQPSVPAAQSLLARIYLIMEQYKEAEESLAEVLKEENELLDYNLLSPNENRPFPSEKPAGTGNPEIIYFSPFISYGLFGISNMEVRVSTELYNMYDDDDLRKSLYFINNGENGIRYRGSYSGSRHVTLFGGLSTDENYLNYAEALVRNEKPDKAIQIVNKLLQTRYKPNTFEPIENISGHELLKYIILERRKSLIGKGMRWLDIRRFNNDDEFFISNERTVENKKYKLEKNDPRLTFAYPANEN